MIEVMFAIRKDGFKDHPVIPEGLDLVDEDDQFTHMLPLDDEYNPEDILSKIQEDLICTETSLFIEALMSDCSFRCVQAGPRLPGERREVQNHQER